MNGHVMESLLTRKAELETAIERNDRERRHLLSDLADCRCRLRFLEDEADNLGRRGAELAGRLADVVNQLAGLCRGVSS